MTFQAVQKTSDDIRLYHTDHLGSTALVTDLDGEVTQHVAYIPYGEIFVEQRNGSWASPYLFNAKELDEETGLYYYGARYLDPTNVAWLSVDPLFEKYVGMTPYGYCAGNPVKYLDSDGNEILINFNIPDLKKSISTPEDAKQFDRDLKERKLNLGLTEYANKFSDNNNVIILFAHGIQNKERTKGIGVFLDGKGKQVKGVKQYLEKNSTLYNKNKKDGVKSVVLLFSCGTGKGEGSIAEKISKEMGVIVIAPTQNIYTEGNNKVPEVYEEGFIFNTGGQWNIYYDGKVVDQMKGYSSIFSSATDMSKFIKDLDVEKFRKEMKQKYDDLNR